MSHDNSVDNLDRPADSRPEIPSIQVTTDFSTPRLTTHEPPEVGSSRPLDSYSPQFSPQSDTHGRSPSEQGLLAPISILRSGRTSLDVPNSPTGSSWGSEGSTHVPPSPTLSTRSSVQFVQPTSLSLRDNHPTERSGYSSLGLLVPGNGNGHGRKSSVTSTLDGSTEDTEPDSHSIGMATLAASPSPTHTHFETSSVGGTTVHERSPSRSQDHKKKVDSEGEEHAEGEPEAERPALDLSQDEEIDAAPFAFKPYHLASLVDPKNLPALRQMGGVQGLLRGLGTHRKHGLSSAGAASSSRHGDSSAGLGKTAQGDGRPGAGSSGAGVGASQRHDRSPDDTPLEAVPGIVVTGDDGHAEDAKLGDLEAAEEADVSSDAYGATMEDRHRVYGQNVLPTRKTKSLLQLMWLALKDKVLVSTAYTSGYPPVMSLSDTRLGAAFYCRGCISGSRLFPRLRYATAGRRAASRLGRRCCNHRRYRHRGTSRSS